MIEAALLMAIGAGLARTILWPVQRRLAARTERIEWERARRIVAEVVAAQQKGDA